MKSAFSLGLKMPIDSKGKNILEHLPDYGRLTVVRMA